MGNTEINKEPLFEVSVGDRVTIWNKVYQANRQVVVNGIIEHPTIDGCFSILVEGNERNITVFPEEVYTMYFGVKDENPHSILFLASNKPTYIKTLVLSKTDCLDTTFLAASCAHVWADTGFHWTYCKTCNEEGHKVGGEVVVKKTFKA